MLSSLGLEHKLKKFFKPLSNSHVSLSFLLIWNWNDKYVSYTPVVPLKTRFQTNMGKAYTRFQTKTAQKADPNGAAHTDTAYLREYPPGDIHIVS